MKTLNRFNKLDMSKVPIAHRGLWNKDVAENSLSAYKNAVEHGFAIEIDLYKSADGELFSVHDRNLSRLTGKDVDICKANTDTVKSLFITGSKEKIPTFKEVLSTVNGKVPILVEIKNQPQKDAVDLIVETLKNYRGEYAVQSFNPLYIKRVKKLSPDTVIGILSTKEKEDLKDEPPLKRFIVKRTPLNFLIKPDFLSLEKHTFPKKKKVPLLAWTVTSEEEYEKLKPFAENIIFEGFVPKI